MAIAHFYTWTTYGTWLSGDGRGWYQRGIGIREPNQQLQFSIETNLAESPVVLNKSDRQLVEQTIEKHCQIKGWELHAAKCLSNHVHVVVTTSDVSIGLPRQQFKSWCTRALCQTNPTRKRWWTDRGWDIYVDTEEHHQIYR
jgi:Transposase IS200 like